MGPFLAGLSSTQRGAAAALLNASVWTLYYYFFLVTPMPKDWTMRIGGPIGLGVAFVGGVVARATSRQFWPVGVGVALGLSFGAGEAYVTDTMVSWLQRVSLGLESCGRFSLYVWMCVAAGWLTAHAVLVQRRTAEFAAGRRTRG